MDWVCIEHNSCLTGQLVQVALIGIIADHPAMVKMAGFADKSHNEAPCTKCRVTKEHMFLDEALHGRKWHAGISN